MAGALLLLGPVPLSSSSPDGWAGGTFGVGTDGDAVAVLSHLARDALGLGPVVQQEKYPSQVGPPFECNGPFHGNRNGSRRRFTLS